MTFFAQKKFSKRKKGKKERPLAASRAWFPSINDGPVGEQKNRDHSHGFCVNDHGFLCLWLGNHARDAIFAALFCPFSFWKY